MDFKVGDVVRIRQWDDMLNEYGKTDDGRIQCNMFTAFIPAMKYLCGRVFTIERIHGDKIFGHGERWTIISEMLEPALDNTPLNDDISNINEYLHEFSTKRSD